MLFLKAFMVKGHLKDLVGKQEPEDMDPLLIHILLPGKIFPPKAAQPLAGILEDFPIHLRYLSSFLVAGHHSGIAKGAPCIRSQSILWRQLGEQQKKYQLKGKIRQ